MAVTFFLVNKRHYTTKRVVFAMEIRPSMAKYRLNAISSFSRYNSRQTIRTKQRLTSTYFEVDGTKALESDLQRYGYSRDKRGDCLQVVVALVLTPDGFPLAYEVMPGNTSDRETQMPFIRRLEEKYVKMAKARTT